jgi:hypothetical protein
MDVERVPLEIWVYMLGMLGVEEFVSVSKTCRYLFWLTCSDMFWEPIYSKAIHENEVNLRINAKIPDKKNRSVIINDRGMFFLASYETKKRTVYVRMSDYRQGVVSACERALSRTLAKLKDRKINIFSSRVKTRIIEHKLNHPVPVKEPRKRKSPVAVKKRPPNKKRKVMTWDEETNTWIEE